MHAPEQRTRIYVTANSAYYIHAGICVGVYDRPTSTWRPEHPVLGQRLGCGVRYHSAGVSPAVEPAVGDALFFDGTRTVTSQITHMFESLSEVPAGRVRRPSRAA